MEEQPPLRDRVKQTLNGIGVKRDRKSVTNDRLFRLRGLQLRGR